MIKHVYYPTEITCICGAYDHPHRLGGGDCDGSAWCASVRSIDSFDCDNCNMNTNENCDVIDGVETLHHERCECLAQEIRTGALEDEFGHLPLDADDYLLKQYNSYHNHD